MDNSTRTSTVDGPVATAPLPSAVLRPTGFESARFDERSLLGAWQATTHSATIGHLVAQVHECGAVDNLRQVRDGGTDPFRGFWFADSDVYKVLEAVAWDAGRTGDSRFVGYIDEMVELLTAVQLADGYINSWFQRIEPERRWKDLGRGHEMYCAGHLIQAGIAASRALGRTDLLEIGRRFADHLVQRFGPGREEGLCGHPEIETALIELYRETGGAEYLELARLMIDRRGRGLLGEEEFGVQYFQDHAPVREATEVTGHAVRQLYLTAGATDVFLETGDRSLLGGMDRQWHSAFETKTYVTGGHGSRHRDEAFGDPYELPSDRAYAETCAAIASFHWNWRMLLATGESRFADTMEWTLLNAIAASTTADGTAFFYSNPLQLRAGHDGSSEDSPSERLPWYRVPCCPPNVGRLVSTLGSYAITSSPGGVQVQLYSAGTYRAPVPSGGEVRLRIEGDYPWSGGITVEVTALTGAALTGAADDGEGADSGEFTISLRIPGWADGVTATVGDEHLALDPEQGYLEIERSWRVGDRIVLDVPMPVRVLHPHPHVDAVRGSVAIARGPLVYCVEQVGQQFESSIDDIVIDPTREPVHSAAQGLPDVRVGLTAFGTVRPRASALYAPTPPDIEGEAVEIAMVPFYRWANRDSDAMRVWMPAAPPTT